jgi:hypothetical protein
MELRSASFGSASNVIRRCITVKVRRLILSLGVTAAVLLTLPAAALAATTTTGATARSSAAAVGSVTVEVAPMALDCGSMSASAHSYAVAHGYCPAGSSSSVSPNNTVGGNCGDSYLYMWNDRAGYAAFHYGFYSTDGTVYYRDLVVSWVNWTHLVNGNYTDATYMWNAGYDTTKGLYTKTGYVSGALSGEVYLWWGGICSILHPTSSTTVTF